MSDWALWHLVRELERRLRIAVSTSSWDELVGMHNPPDVSASELFQFACRRLGSGRYGYDPDPAPPLCTGTRCAVCEADISGLAAGGSCPVCGTSISDPRQVRGHVVASIVAALGVAPKSVRKATLLRKDLGMIL